MDVLIRLTDVSISGILFLQRLAFTDRYLLVTSGFGRIMVVLDEYSEESCYHREDVSPVITVYDLRRPHLRDGISLMICLDIY